MEEIRKYPYWVNERERCEWCYKMCELNDVHILEGDEPGVYMDYVCSNPECRYLTTFNKKSVVKGIQYGKLAVDVFVKRQKEYHMSQNSGSGNKCKSEQV